MPPGRLRRAASGPDGAKRGQRRRLRDNTGIHAQEQTRADKMEATEFPLSLALRWGFRNTGPQAQTGRESSTPATLPLPLPTSAHPLGTGEAERETDRATTRRRTPSPQPGRAVRWPDVHTRSRRDLSWAFPVRHPVPAARWQLNKFLTSFHEVPTLVIQRVSPCSDSFSVPRHNPTRTPLSFFFCD